MGREYSSTRTYERSSNNNDRYYHTPSAYVVKDERGMQHTGRDSRDPLPDPEYQRHVQNQIRKGHKVIDASAYSQTNDTRYRQDPHYQEEDYRNRIFPMNLRNDEKYYRGGGQRTATSSSAYNPPYVSENNYKYGYGTPRRGFPESSSYSSHGYETVRKEKDRRYDEDSYEAEEKSRERTLMSKNRRLEEAAKHSQSSKRY